MKRKRRQVKRSAVSLFFYGVRVFLLQHNWTNRSDPLD
jgi:hypothetical protein